MGLPPIRLSIWAESYEEYNCSALENIDWYSRGVSRPYLGLFCIIFGIVMIPPYVMCALAMWSMRNLSVYKIMFYLAAADISSIVFTCIGFGIASIRGEVYCTHPRAVLAFSQSVELSFHCSSTACALLALNRFGEMLSIPFITWFFQGSRTWILLGLATILVIVLVLFTPPVLFNSRLHMFLFDPMIFDGDFANDSYLKLAYSVFMPTFSLAMYLSMLAGLIRKHGMISKGSDALSRATYQIMSQSGVIIATHLTAMIVFQIIQFVPASAVDFMLYLCHFDWMLMHTLMPDQPLFRFNLWIDSYAEYNCSAVGEVDWHSEGVSRPYLGVFCITYGVVMIPLYLACAVAMWQMRHLSVYKIMIYLAVADIWDLIFASIGFGFMSITGQVYCTHPQLQLYFSLGVEFFFFCSTTACALLALNRFGEMLAVPPIVWLFQGSTTWVVLGMSTVPVGLLVLFTPLMLFNSKYHMLFFDPMIFEGGKYSYDSYVHFGCVVFMPTFSLVMYLSMFAGLACKHGNILKGSDAMNRVTFQTLFQSGVIILIHLSSMLAFQILQFLPASAVDTMLYFAHFGWMMVHGTPPIVYLSLNHAIRQRLLDFLRPNRRTKRVSVSSRQFA